MVSSKYGEVKLLQEGRDACDSAMAEAKRSIADYDRHVAATLADERLSKASVRFLRELWNGEAFDVALTSANKTVSLARTRAIVLALLEDAERDPTAVDGPTRYRLLTNCPDLGVTSIEASIINPKAIVNHSYQNMKRMDLHGFGCLDLALMHDFDVWKPDYISLHSHAAIRSHDPKFKPEVAAKACCPKRAPQNRFGADVVDISSRCDKYEGLERIAQLGRYMSKISCGTKYPIDGKYGRRTITSQRYWHVPEALRGLEAYSHLSPLGTMGGIGEGRALRSRIKELFASCLEVKRLPYGVEIDHEWLKHKWRRLHREIEMSNYAALVVK